MAEVHRIGIALSLADNVTQALQLIGRNVFHVHGQVANLQSAFDRVGRAIVGSIGLFAGTAIIRGMDRVIEKTKELSREMSKLEVAGAGYELGISPDVFAEQVYRRAVGVTRQVRGITQTQAVQTFGQIYSMIGAGPAGQVLEPLARFGVATGQVTGRGYNANDMNSIVRAAQQMGRLTNARGAYDQERFTSFLNTMFQMTAATEGRVGPREFLALASTGMLPLQQMTDAGIMGAVMVAQGMGASRAGTALTSIFQQIMRPGGGNAFTQGNVGEWLRLGLINETDVTGNIAGAGGALPHHLRVPHGLHRIAGEGRGGSRGRLQLTPAARERLGSAIAADPLGWVVHTLIPQMEAQPDLHGNTEAQLREVMTLFSNRTAQRFTAEEVKDYQRMLEERTRMEHARGDSPAYDIFMQRSIPMNLDAMGTAWTKFLETMTKVSTGDIIWTLQAITSGLEKLTDIIGRHPTATRLFLDGLAGIAAIVVVGGALALAFSAGGWVIGGFTALASLLAAGGPIILALGVAGTLVLGITALSSVLQTDWKGYFDGLVTGIRNILGIKGPDYNIPVPPGWNWQRGAPGGGTGWDPATGRLISPTAPTAPEFYGPPIPPGGLPGAYGPPMPPSSGTFNRRGTFFGPGGRMLSPTAPGGLGGPSLGTGGANFMKGPPPNSSDLVKIGTAAGNITAHPAAAADMQGFVNDLVAAGAPIHDIGSYNRRFIAGSNRWSQHAYGTALDIEQSGRNAVSPGFRAWANAHPAELKQILARHHMISGGDWHGKQGPDFGHFEWGGPGSRDAVVPKAHDKSSAIEVPVYLDGQKIAHSTMRQMIAGMNTGAGGSRIPDYTSILPQPT